MAVDFQITQSDTKPFIQMRLYNPDGTNPDLTGATVRLVVKSTGGTVIVNSNVTVIDPIKATIEYHWLAGDTVTAGSYVAQVKVTYVDGSKESYPDDATYIQVQINATLA